MEIRSGAQGKNSAAITQLLEQRILHGLACEWKNAVLILRPPLQQEMKLPLFAIRDMASRLGTWSPDREEICLSRSLVMNHSWDAVVEVLIHEMAHQLADQLWKVKDESSHGPSFLKACRLLRANPKASGQYPALDDVVKSTSGQDSDHRLRRIKKLMALAASQNVHEADAAMIKAHQLIKTYNIDLIELHENRDFLSIFLGKPALRHTRDDYLLARILREFYFVDCMWVSAFVAEKNKMGRVLEITGTLLNLQTASYVFDYVNRFLESRWNDYRRANQVDFRRRVDFREGILMGFRSKLGERITPLSGKNQASNAILPVSDPLLKAHMSYKYPYTRTVSRRAGDKDPAVVSDGISEGKKLVIARGITGTAKSDRLLP